MERLGEKKFLITSSSGFFAILTIPIHPHLQIERGVMTFMYMDDYGFARNWDDSWFGLENYIHIVDYLVDEGERICKQNNVELYSY